MEKTLKILLLEDNFNDAELIQRFLLKDKLPCEFRLAMNKKHFLKGLEDFSPDVILSDNSLPQFSSVEALHITRQRSLNVPFIIVTGTMSEEFAADIIKQGADDYILKDRLTRLPVAIITALEKRRTEQEIADYRYALDQSAIVAITDQKGIITYANANFCKISKYTAEELIGHDHRIINSGYHDKSYIRYLWASIANGKIWRGEFCNRAKDGSLYWVDTTIIPFLNENKKPYQYLSIRIDITEKKLFELELKKSNERFQYATKATSDIIWELNFDSKQYMVHAGKEIFWDANKELNWQSVISGNYILEEDRKRVRRNFLEARKDPARDLWQDEYRVYAAGNSIMYIINHAIFIRNKKGKAIRTIGAITDITEKKKLEAELLEQQRKEQVNITATALEAQEKERNAIGQELHDNVNQILVGTKLVLSMIKKNPEKTEELIATSLAHLQKAIDENRKIAHILVVPDLDTISLTDQLTYLTDSMLKTLNIDVHIDVTSLQENLLSNDQKLAVYRIAQEQCTNIVKYAKASSVNLSLSTTESLFEMIITDNGRGMEISAGTTGIGLRNIKGRLSIFKGVASITTSPGNGFTLEIAIPLSE